MQTDNTYTPENHGKPWTLEECEALIDLIDRGVTYREAADALGRTTSACKNQTSGMRREQAAWRCK